MSDPTLKDMLLTSMLKQSILNIGVSLPLGMEISFYRDDDDQNVCMQVVNPDGGNTIYRFLKSTPLPPTSAYKLLREQELEQVLRDLLITIDLHTDGHVIANCETTGQPKTECSIARRIVACVKACAGLDTEFLELSCGHEPAVWHGAAIGRLRKQRDELLAGAKKLLSRKRPGAIAGDQRLILEIDCLALDEIVEGIEKQGGAA